MTAVPERRTRSVWIALLAAFVALSAGALLSVAGVRTLADSTAGRRADDAPTRFASRRLPFTPTALVGTLDEDGRLTSLVVMAIEPDGTGGSIVSLPVTADAGTGEAGEVYPLGETLLEEGPEALRLDVEAITGLSFDVVELVDRRRFAQLIGPLGELPVELPVSLHDRSSDEGWEAGPQMFGAAEAARAVTATDETIADWYLEPARSAVWAGVASRVGAGIGSAAVVEPGADVPVPTSLDVFLDRMFAAAVGFRSLGFAPVEDAGRDVDVVELDRAEVVMVLTGIAPARVGAPLAAPTFRIETSFDEADLERLGVTSADVIKFAVDRLLFVQVNVVSVAEHEGAVPAVTQLAVTDPDLIEPVREAYPDLFGEIEVVATDEIIRDVDVIVTLGRSFLDELPADLGEGGQDADDAAGTGTGGPEATDVAGSGDDDTTD